MLKCERCGAEMTLARKQDFKPYITYDCPHCGLIWHRTKELQDRENLIKMIERN